MSKHKEPPLDFVRDVIDPGWREREEKTSAFWNSISVKQTTGYRLPARREHAASADCWCNPTIDYVNPDTGAAVYVHHEPN